jgi:hypothetical protein
MNAIASDSSLLKGSAERLSTPAVGRAELERLREAHDRALRAAAAAEARARAAERRLRSRLVALTWPATLGGIAGGFAAVVGLRLAGL